MRAAEYSECGWWEGKGDKGSIDSVAPITVPTGRQVKEGGDEPTDCARKRGGTERGG